MFADEQMERIRREELEILQLERLRKIIAWTYDKSAFYQRTFQANAVKPEDIQSLADVSKLPLMTRDELVGNEFELLTLPLSSVVRISRVGWLTRLCTRGDIRNNVEMMIRALMAANILRGSVVGIGGDLSDSRLLDVLYALESIGATVALNESHSVETVITLAEDTLTYKNFKLPAPPEGNLFYQCNFGCHVHEDNFLAEIVSGELVITTLTAQALPLIRYRTGRTAKKICEPCPCGRTFTRIILE